MSEIIPGKLYLGDAWLPKSDAFLQKWKITDIINTAADVMRRESEKQHWKNDLKIDYYHFSMDDSLDFNLFKQVPEIASLLHILISNNQVCYVHCAMGINRSAAVVVAYLILYENMSYEEAFQDVNKKRPGILSNTRFVSDLKQLAIQQRKIEDTEQKQKEIEDIVTNPLPLL